MARKKVAKAVDAQRGAGQPSWSLATTPYQINVQTSYGGAPNGQSSGIIRGTGADWFGPLNPMAPTAPPDVAGRQLDFVSGYNLNQTPRAYEPIGFPQLRALADVYDILRLVIETRKDEVSGLAWGIRPKDRKLRARNAKIDGTMQTRIDAVMRFLEKPDGQRQWDDWLRMLLEDLYVIDAPTLYRQRTRSGGLFAMMPIDGATIKRVIDDWGRTPMPYVGVDGTKVVPPAYQQVLKGLPAVDYAASDLIYKPRNMRTGKIYGYSPVEQILLTVNIALRRQMWQLSYYSEGNIPEALIGVPDNWTPQQIKDYQAYFDAYFTGDLAARRRAKFVPGAMAKNVVQTKDPEMMNVFDEWLARVVCFSFSISPQAFVRMMNRGTAQTSQETATEQGLQPSKRWVKGLLDGILIDDFNSPDLEFYFEEEEEIDQEKAATNAKTKSSAGLISINEARADLGEEASDDPAADKLMVLTAKGLVPIDANTPEAKQAAIAAGLAPDPTALPAPGEFGTKPAAKPGDKKPPAEANKTGNSKSEKARRYSFAKHVCGPECAHPIAPKPALEKASKRRVRRLAPVPFDRPDTRKAMAAVRGIFWRLFQAMAPKITMAVKSDLAKADETPEEKARRIADSLDLSAFNAVYDKVASELASVAEESGRQALVQMGVEDGSELYDQVSERSVAWAEERAAELLGMSVNDAGDLVENPDAEWAVTESTRDMVRDAIASGLEDNIGSDAIADNIVALGFSQDRADLIARTEIGNANSQASLEGYRDGRDAGVNVKKEWLLGPNPCPICEDNAAEGPIDLDDDFPSGDDAPTAHPNCECALMPVVEDDGGDGNEAEAE